MSFWHLSSSFFPFKVRSHKVRGKTKFNDATKSSGELTALPKYDYDITFAIICYGKMTGFPYECGECLVHGLLSASKVPLGTAQGSHIAYTNVAIFNGENGEGGKREMTYAYTKDALNYAVPFAQHDSYDWKRGNLEQEIDYKKTENTYVEIKKTNNYYNYGRYVTNPSVIVGNGTNSYFKKGYVVALDYPNRVRELEHYTDFTKVNQYNIFAPWVSLSSSISIQDGITTTTNYTYDEATGRHAQAKIVKTTNSNGEELSTETTYTKDLPTSTDAAIQACNTLNMLAPVEQKTYLGTKQLGGSKNKYELVTVNGKSIPFQTQWIGITKDNTELLHTTATYTPTDGFVNSVVSRSSTVPKTYIWENGLVKSETIGNFIQSVTYKPITTLIQTITDENSFKTSFIYDGLQRLKEANAFFANGDPKSTTTYNYNYFNPLNPLSATNCNAVATSTAFVGIATPLSSKQVLDGLGRPISGSKENYDNQNSQNGENRHVANYISYDQ